jgi:hypothetical protein
VNPATVNFFFIEETPILAGSLVRLMNMTQ